MTPTQHEKQIVNDLHEKIISNPYPAIDIAAIISHHPISPVTIIRIYKKTFGKSPAQHRQQILMELGKALIQQGQPIKFVSSHLGYRDTSNFSKTFKKVIGQLPSNFKLTEGPSQ